MFPLCYFIMIDDLSAGQPLDIQGKKTLNTAVHRDGQDGTAASGPKASSRWMMDGCLIILSTDIEGTSSVGMRFLVARCFTPWTLFARCTTSRRRSSRAVSGDRRLPEAEALCPAKILRYLTYLPRYVRT